MSVRRLKLIPGLPGGSQMMIGVGLLLAVASLVVVFTGTSDHSGGLTNVDRVLTDLEQQVKDEPQNADLRMAVAAVYAERGMFSDAIAQYEQALVLVPDQPAALIGLGRARLAANQPAEAEEPLRRVADSYADNPARYGIDELGRVYYDLGVIALGRGAHEEGRDWFQESLKVNKTDADAWRMLGTAYERSGVPAEAERAYLSAVRLVPDYSEVYRALEALYTDTGDEGRRSYASGMVQLQAGNVREAVSLLESATQRSPQLAQAYEGLGIAYEATDRKEDAIAAYRRAMELDPNAFLAGLALDRLSKG